MEHDDHVQVPATRQAPPTSAGAEPGPPGVAPAEVGGKIPPVSLADIQAFNSSRNKGFRYSAEQRFQVLQCFQNSEQTLTAFSVASGVSMSSLSAWCKGASSGRAQARKAGRHFSPEERRRTIEAYEKAGLTRHDFCKVWGVSPHTLTAWLSRYRDGGPKALENKAPAKGDKRLVRKIAPETIKTIEETKRKYPDFGLRRVRDFVARFSGPRVSLGSVKRTLDDAGIEPLPSPKPRRKAKKRAPRRFERAKAGQLWQSDITSFHLPRDSRRVYLTVFLDDHSRFIVSWTLACHQKSELVTEALFEGLGRFGRPDEILTDQGRQYYAWRGKSGFQKILIREGIDHIVSRAHHPQTLGKCERLWQTVEREFWTRAQPVDLSDARERFGHWVSHYNFFRPHQGTDGLVPADRFFGAEDSVRAAIEARLSKDEIGAAIDEKARTRMYLYGQIGDERIAMSGEQGKLVVHTPGGEGRELSLDALGAGTAATGEPEVTAVEAPVKDEATEEDNSTDNTTNQDKSNATERNGPAGERSYTFGAGLGKARIRGANQGFGAGLDGDERGRGASALLIHRDEGPGGDANAGGFGAGV